MSRLFVVVALWCIGLVLFPWWRAHSTLVPGQQSWAPVALLATQSFILVAVGLPVLFARVGARSSFGRFLPSSRRLTSSALKGIIDAAFVILALHLLLYHRYVVAPTPSRIALSSIFLLPALTGFSLLEAWLIWAVGHRSFGVQMLSGFVLAGATVFIGGRYMERMEVLPLYVVAAALCLYTAYRCRSDDTIARPLFGAFVTSWALAAVCPLY